MAQLISNKTFKRFLGIALSVLLVATLSPGVQQAYGDSSGETAQPEVSAVAESGAASEPAGNQTIAQSVEATASIDEPRAASVAPAPPSKGVEKDGTTYTVTADTAWSPTFSGSASYTLIINEGVTLKGSIKVETGATLTIGGTGTIDGEKKVGTVILVDGGNSTLVIGRPGASEVEDCVTIVGGKGGTKQYKNDVSSYTVGGGIAVLRTYAAGEDGRAGTGATLVFNQGVVRDNTAQAGGGIFVDRGCYFVMKDGVIERNTATKGEGGGLFVAGGTKHAGSNKWTITLPDKTVASNGVAVSVPGTPTIEKGTISNNRTETTFDWGGGGVFVESKGVLKLGTTLVTKNTAKGLGGGVSGCPHASIGIGSIDEGYALYDNTAEGTGWPTNEWLINKLTATYDGKTYIVGDVWANRAKGGISASNAMDYYCTNASYIKGYGDKQIAWNGYAVGDGTTPRDVTIYKGQSFVVQGESLGLTSTATGTTKNRDITIENNYSATHGGGIGCNGTLVMAPVPSQPEWNSLGWQIKKVLKNSAGKAAELKDGEFVFELVDGKGKVVARASSDASGNVAFTLDSEHVLDGIDAGATGTKTFTLREVKPSEPSDGRGIIYFDGEPTVVMTIKHQVQTTAFPNQTLNVVTHTPELIEVTVDGVSYSNEAYVVENEIDYDEIFHYSTVEFKAKKEMKNHLGQTLSALNGRVFDFELLGADCSPMAASNDGATGDIVFSNIAISSQVAGVTAEQWNKGEEREVVLRIREVPASGSEATAEDIEYDTAEHTVTFKVRGSATVEVHDDTGIVDTAVELTVVPGSLKFDGEEASDAVVVNTLNIKGAWTPEATKRYYGVVTDDIAFTFSLRQVAGPEADDEDAGRFDPENVDLAGLLAAEGPTAKGAAAEFDESGVAAVAFEKQMFTQPGTYWFLMTEDGVGEAAPGDPTVYAFKVKVTVSQDRESLEASVEKVYFAPSPAATALTELTGDESGEVPGAEFYNTDMNMQLSLYGYSVNAMSGEPVGQKCLVDPKVYKKLDGRSLRADEFHFKLIQVNDYNDTTGTVISATGNDQYGMVDFDAAANVAGEGDDPCCLLFTGAGSYYYRVIEDADYQRDPSVKYSDEVITFTAEIRWCDAEGVVVGDGLTKTADAAQLKCVDMYYGRLVDGKNVRFEESADPNWHPTITNVARPVDLQVRKTSVLDRTEGLEGATYALYMVNDAEQGDVYLAEATSDADGWIYYKDVPLNSGNLYYFKETAAPAGHTVSEFRSPYFYLEAADNGTGFVMRYTDAKPLSATAQVALKAAGANQATAPETDADGNLVFTYENEGGVYDEATEVNFNKLDTRTHEWVEGAKLSIVEKDSGIVVSSWTSGKAPEKLQKVLNVGTTYILREDEAPAGYQKANDVEFVIDQYGKVAVISGAENGNAELSGSTITLYDTAIDAEEVVTEERVTTREVPGDGRHVTKESATPQRLAQTGDVLPLACLGGLMLISVMVAAFALRRGRMRR